VAGDVGVLSSSAFFAIALPDAMLGVAWPFMRVSFNQPLAAMTLVLPFGVAATVVAASSWTWAAARIGLGRLLTRSVTLSALALLCCAVAPAYWLVVACAVLFGLSSGPHLFADGECGDRSAECCCGWSWHCLDAAGAARSQEGA